jgi:L-ascorbate metabolism protein UlaG (beta-lactamase superfamily)
MLRRTGISREDGAISLLSLILLAMVSMAEWAGVAIAAETLCEPGFVRSPTASPTLLPVSFSRPASAFGVVAIRWVGHSSFLIVTPAGVTALTDPSAWHPSIVAPDVVTISNEHPTHSQVRSVPGTPRILRGYTPEGVWTEVNATIGDLTINNIPSTGGNAQEFPTRNTIFVFRAEGLCVVHLGNLRQVLGEEQRRRIGRPDVLMVPIDGHWTLSYEQLALTITQLRPSIVLPMHYDAAEHARVFMAFINATVPVRTQVESTLNISRGTLPTATAVIVLGYDGG